MEMASDIYCTLDMLRDEVDDLANSLEQALSRENGLEKENHDLIRHKANTGITFTAEKVEELTSKLQYELERTRAERDEYKNNWLLSVEQGREKSWEMATIAAVNRESAMRRAH